MSQIYIHWLRNNSIVPQLFLFERKKSIICMDSNPRLVFDHLKCVQLKCAQFFLIILLVSKLLKFTHEATLRSLYLWDWYQKESLLRTRIYKKIRRAFCHFLTVTVGVQCNKPC